MKRNILLITAMLTALVLNVKAQDIAFDSLSAGLEGIKAAASAVPDPVIASAEVSVSSVATAAQREWLVMVFINGVNDLGILGAANSDINEMEEVGSTDMMAVVVEYGLLGADASARGLQFQRDSKTIYITKDNDSKKITSKPFYTTKDSDMGSAAKLARFVKRGVRRYPAKKIAVIVWNHGSGQLGISYDDVSKNHMEIDQLGLALAEIRDALGRKIEVFATDACLMQMASVAYELKDSAEVIVGSEESIQNNGYPYDTFLGSLAANPGMSGEQLGALLVDAYGASYTQDATLSALRASALPEFVWNLNKWVEAVKAEPEAFKAATSADLIRATSRFSNEDSKDLYDYLKRVNARLPDGSRAKGQGEILSDNIISRLIIRNVAKPRGDYPYTRARGLAIYLPAMLYNSANYEKFAFSRDSLWDDFLRDITEERVKP